MLLHIERFSNECRKTKTKVITPANHNRHKLSNEPIRTRSKYMLLASSAGKKRANASKSRLIGLSFTPDWSRKWREIF